MKPYLNIFLLLICISLNNLCIGQTSLWGMTSDGGADNLGVIFETDGNGNNCVSHSFLTPYPGKDPAYSHLCEASNGILYGMTEYGGAYDYGVLFEYDPSNNNYIKKLDFNGVNGAYPGGSLIEVANGKLYGLAFSGGANSGGVLFEYDLDSNNYTIKYNFDGGINGGLPSGSLNESSNGRMYGLTYVGGINNLGVLFEYDPSG